MAPAYASDCEEASAANIGDTVECTGVLMPRGWVEECIHCKEVELPKVRLNLTACDDELDATQNVYGAFRAQCETHIVELEDLVRKAARIERPWYESNLLWGIGGIVLGVAGTYVLVTKW